MEVSDGKIYISFSIKRQRVRIFRDVYYAKASTGQSAVDVEP